MSDVTLGETALCRSPICNGVRASQQLIDPVTHRLRLAGCEIPLFEPPAVEALFQSARGLPRLINRIAHYALTAAAVIRPIYHQTDTHIEAHIFTGLS